MNLLKHGGIYQLGIYISAGITFFKNTILYVIC